MTDEPACSIPGGKLPTSNLITSQQPGGPLFPTARVVTPDLRREYVVSHGSDGGSRRFAPVTDYTAIDYKGSLIGDLIVESGDCSVSLDIRDWRTLDGKLETRRMIFGGKDAKSLATAWLQSVGDIYQLSDQNKSDVFQALVFLDMEAQAV